MAIASATCSSATRRTTGSRRRCAPTFIAAWPAGWKGGPEDAWPGTRRSLAPTSSRPTATGCSWAPWMASMKTPRSAGPATWPRRGVGPWRAAICPPPWDSSIGPRRCCLRRRLGGRASRATQREVDRPTPLFEARDDPLGRPKARRRLAMVYRTRRDVRSMEQELEQAIEHARAAGDAREEARSLGLLATAGLLGPTPVPDAIERCRRIRAEAAGNRTVERAVLLALAGLEAMAGETEAAQGHLEEHRRLCAEMGLRLDAAAGAIPGGLAGLLGD